MRRFLLFIVFISASLYLRGQSVNNIQLSNIQTDHSRKNINIPNIPGYITLKCDFHIHTIFSDGVVWPEVRVQEAWEEGLDAISITDHIENQPSKKYVGGDHNASYDVALKKAQETRILLIKGGEITRGMPPGHLNALFLSDVNLLATETPFQAIEAAVKQNAFIIWNHPGWKAQQPDTCLWWPEHEVLYKKGWIHGIEVFNEKEWYPIALDWCINKNLAVFANSDIHDINAHFYDVVNGHRPMTLVFCKEKTVNSIREAMFANRTVAFFDNKLAGKEEYLEAIFRASIEIDFLYKNKDLGCNYYCVRNSSDINFIIESSKKEVVIYAKSSKIISFPIEGREKEIKVKNMLTGSGKCLQIAVELPL